MRKLILFLLLAACRQAPSQAVVEAPVWPPPQAALVAPLPVAVSPAEAVSPSTAATP